MEPHYNHQGSHQILHLPEHFCRAIHIRCHEPIMDYYYQESILISSARTRITRWLRFTIIWISRLKAGKEVGMLDSQDRISLARKGSVHHSTQPTFFHLVWFSVHLRSLASLRFTWISTFRIYYARYFCLDDSMRDQYNSYSQAAGIPLFLSHSYLEPFLAGPVFLSFG